MANDNREIIKFLLENLTTSLTQMVAKYESISKDCDRIEEKTDSLHGQMHDVKEIKDIVSGIRSQCDQNHQSLVSILATINATKVDLEELLVKTSDNHAEHSAKLDAITTKLNTIDGRVAAGFTADDKEFKNLDTKVDDVRAKVAPVTKVAKMISTPLGLVLFIFGILAAMYLVHEIGIKTMEGIFGKKDSPPAAHAPADTNVVGRTGK